MFKSKIFMCVALLAVVLVICFTYAQRTAWWCFIDVFCIFMAVFLQLMALTLGAKIPSAGRQFSFLARVFCISGIVAFVGEAIAWYVLF